METDKNKDVIMEKTNQAEPKKSTTVEETRVSTRFMNADKTAEVYLHKGTSDTNLRKYTGYTMYGYGKPSIPLCSVDTQTNNKARIIAEDLYTHYESIVHSAGFPEEERAKIRYHKNADTMVSDGNVISLQVEIVDKAMLSNLAAHCPKTTKEPKTQNRN